MCTHSRRDQCCAQHGRALLTGLLDQNSPLRDRIWECSHIGGHRFAPVTLSLPCGIVHGRMNIPEGVAMLALLGQGKVLPDRMRGEMVMVRGVDSSSWNAYAGAFNAMIWPLHHLSIRGVFFYQGENNVFDHEDPFPKTFPGVVTSWREAFGDPLLPVCIVQISGWGDAEMLHGHSKIPVIQEAQHQAHLAAQDEAINALLDKIAGLEKRLEVKVK